MQIFSGNFTRNSKGSISRNILLIEDLELVHEHTQQELLGICKYQHFIQRHHKQMAKAKRSDSLLLNNVLAVLVILVLAVNPIHSLKQSEVGRHDWQLENIGLLSDFKLTKNNKLFFVSELNSFGYLNLHNGSVESRFALNEHQEILSSPIGLSSAESSSIKTINSNNQVVSYSINNLLQRESNNRFLSEKSLLKPEHYLKTDSHDEFMIDKRSVFKYSHTTQETTQIYEAAEDEILQTLFVSESKDTPFVVMVSGQSQVLIQELIIQSNGKIDNSVARYPLFNSSQLDPKILSVVFCQRTEKSLVLVLELENSRHKTIVLNEKKQKNKTFEILKVVESRPLQMHLGQLIFSQETYDLKSKKTVERRLIHDDETRRESISVEEGQRELTLFKENSPFSSIRKPQSRDSLHAHKVFLLPSKTETEFYVAVQYTDLRLQFYHVGSEGSSKILWHREESLAYIEKVLFMKYPYSDHLDNAYHRSLLSESYRQKSLTEKLIAVPSSFAIRITEQVQDFIALLQNTCQKLINFDIKFLERDRGAHERSPLEIDWKSLLKFTMSEDQEVKLGLKKYFIAITQQGTLFAIDTKRGQVVWKNSKLSPNEKTVSLIKLRKDYELDSAILICYDSQESRVSLYEIGQNDGSLTLLKNYRSEQTPSIHKLNAQALLIKVGSRTVKYQIGHLDHISEEFQERNYYFYTESKNKLTGWQLITPADSQERVENSALDSDSVSSAREPHMVETWNLHLEPQERILKTTTSFRGNSRSLIPLIDNDNVIFKNVDFTNIAVLTSKNATSLSLYIINGRTGQVHFNEYKSGLNLNHPLNLQYDENNVIVTYYNNRNKIFEIWTVEAYQERIETSALSMITDYLEEYQHRPSSNRQSIIFLSEVYGSPVPIKKLFISESRESLIKRNLVIVTRDNKLYSISRELISARRPKENSYFSNQAYPPYQYLIPYESNKFFSHGLALSLPSSSSTEIRFSSSDMESTLFILAYGLGSDLFMIRMAPDGNFDMIGEDFNYVVLVIIMIAATAAVLYLKRTAKNAKRAKHHRD